MDFSGGSDSKEFTCNAGKPGSIPEMARYLGKEMAAHSSILAWRIPWTVEPGGLQSMGSQRVGHDLVTEQKQTNKQQSSTKLPRMHSEEKTASLIKGAGKTGQPHAKE